MTINDIHKTTNVIALCYKYYDKKTFEHCLQVAKYAVENKLLTSEDMRITAYNVAMCHDLLKDTDASVDEIAVAMNSSPSFVNNVMTALTKEPDEKYIDYIIRLKECNSPFPYIVKLADMKDHLMRKETLTDKLKEKYWEALPYLL